MPLVGMLGEGGKEVGGTFAMAAVSSCRPSGGYAAAETGPRLGRPQASPGEDDLDRSQSRWYYAYIMARTERASRTLLGPGKDGPQAEP